MNLAWIFQTKKYRSTRTRRTDVMLDQVKKVLTDADQKLILMVRG